MLVQPYSTHRPQLDSLGGRLSAANQQRITEQRQCRAEGLGVFMFPSARC